MGDKDMTGLGLYTNRTSRHDFVRNAFSAYGDPACNVYIAVAFFTDPSVIKKLASQGCTIRLVVRLGFPWRKRSQAHQGKSVLPVVRRRQD